MGEFGICVVCEYLSPDRFARNGDLARAVAFLGLARVWLPPLGRLCKWELGVWPSYDRYFVCCFLRFVVTRCG